MRWLVALWLDFWRGPFTANPAPEVVRDRMTGRLTRVLFGPPARGPREFTFTRRQ